MGATGYSLLPLLILVIVGVAIFSIYKKKKNAREANPFLSTRKSKDEVWKTIKQFQQTKNDKGKEIIDSYVVKRNHPDYIDPNGSFLERKNKTYELKIREWQFKNLQKEAKANGTKAPVKPKNKDLFVVVYKARDIKTKEEMPYRCFECEVVNTKISKKQYDRKIVIHGELDFDKEMEWIAPIRAAEQAKVKQMEARIAKQKAQQAAAEKKRREKAEKRAKKYAKN